MSWASMLIFLPWATLLVLFLNLTGRDSDQEPRLAGLPTPFLGAVVVWGGLLVVLTEGLSLMRAITQGWLALAWLLSLFAVSCAGWQKGTFRRGWTKLRESFRQTSRTVWGFRAAVALLCLSLLLIAIVAPPSNVDSLIYHMARVVHWAQNHSLEHFATMNFGQILKPIWAEAAILNLRVLWGSDRPANLVQWFSMVTSLVAVSGLARLLGADRRGQMLAVAFAVSVPMGTLQATSTQNDYVVTMWVLCLAYFVVRSKKTSASWLDIALIGGAFGLGLLTKGTFYAYAPPLMIWFFLPRLRKPGFLITLAQGALVAAIAVVLNLGFWGRNLATYGGLFGPPGSLAGGPLVLTRLLSPSHPVPAESTPAPQESGAPAQQAGEVTPPDEIGATGQAVPSSGIVAAVTSRLRWLLQRLAQNIGQNTVMPTSFITSRLWAGMRSLPWLFDEGFVDSLSQGMWNHEDTAGSLLHLLLAMGAIVYLGILAFRREAARRPAIYGVVAFACYLMLTLISYSVELFGVRYQLPFFVMCAPLVAVAFAAASRKGWLLTLVGALLLVSAIPYVLLNNTRPLVGWRPKTRVESVLTADPADLVFAIAPDVADEYAELAGRIGAGGCKGVGLMTGASLEYGWWWLLQAPQSGVRIENLVSYPPLDMYADDSFKPCAVICTICGEEEVVQGLPLAVDYGHVRLFSASQ